MGWGEPRGITTEAEQAIRRDERRLIARLLDGDIRRLAHLLGRVLSDPQATYDERQKAVRLLDDRTRRQLLALLDGDLKRMALFICALVEERDRHWEDISG